MSPGTQFPNPNGLLGQPPQHATLVAQPRCVIQDLMSHHISEKIVVPQGSIPQGADRQALRNRKQRG
jgi:hypothetical protein